MLIIFIIEIYDFSAFFTANQLLLNDTLFNETFCLKKLFEKISDEFLSSAKWIILFYFENIPYSLFVGNFNLKQNSS